MLTTNRGCCNAENGQLTIIICALYYFLLSQIKINERLLNGVPNGSEAWCSEFGWIK